MQIFAHKLAKPAAPVVWSADPTAVATIIGPPWHCTAVGGIVYVRCHAISGGRCSDATNVCPVSPTACDRN